MTTADIEAGLVLGNKGREGAKTGVGGDDAMKSAPEEESKTEREYRLRTEKRSGPARR